MKSRLARMAIPGGLLLLWFLGLWLLSSLPGKAIMLPPIPYSDKVAHFSYFMVGGILLAWCLRTFLGWRDAVVILVALVGMGAIGASDELHQLFTPGRSGADLGDWAADLLGSLTGILSFILIHGKIIARKTNS